MPPFTVDLAQNPNWLLFATVRLEGSGPNGRRSVGTAFFFGDGSISQRAEWHLITNVHVIEGCDRFSISCHEYPRTYNQRVLSIEAQRLVQFNGEDIWTRHSNETVDLCATPVTRVFGSADNAKQFFFTSIGSHGISPRDEEVRYSSVMQIAMAGYPNGLADEYNNLPLIRRGTTASHPGIDFENRRDVAVDIACFPGSSGSPIIYYDPEWFASAFRFLGVLYAGPTITDDGSLAIKPIPVTKTLEGRAGGAMMHLGYAIKAQRVLEVVSQVRDPGRGV